MQQCGFLPGRGTEAALSLLEAAIFTADGCGAGDACIFLDIERAFPTVSQAFIRAVPVRAAAPPWLLRALDAMCRNLSARFVLQRCLGQSFRLRRGLRQGCPLSGLLFAIASDPLIRWANSCLPGDSFLISFADDLACVLRKMESEGANFPLELEDFLARVASLKLNHAKICGIALHQSTKGAVFDEISRRSARWMQAIESEHHAYLGYGVGRCSSAITWKRVIKKLETRAAIMTIVPFGAPALIRLARNLLWSITHHVMAVMMPDACLEATFERLCCSLFRGPSGWLSPKARRALSLIGWASLPPQVAELSFRLRVRAVIRHPDWRTIGAFERAKEGFAREDQLLVPFLGDWFRNSLTFALGETARVGILHGFFCLSDDGASVSVGPRLQRCLWNPKARARLLFEALVKDGAISPPMGHELRAWFLKRSPRVLGSEWSSLRRLERVMHHIRLAAKTVPPRAINAFTRLMLDGGLLQSPGIIERKCLLCCVCGGENLLCHYVYSRCWHGTISSRYPLGVNIPLALTRPPSRELSGQIAWVAFWLVKSLNWARFAGRCKMNAVEHIFKVYR